MCELYQKYPAWIHLLIRDELVQELIARQQPSSGNKPVLLLRLQEVKIIYILK